MNDSAIICEEVIDADAKLSPKDNNDKTKTIPTIFNENKVTCKTQIFYILHEFLLITIRLLVCTVIKIKNKFILII